MHCADGDEGLQLLAVIGDHAYRVVVQYVYSLYTRMCLLHIWKPHP
jgi:hypothetical protein